MTTYQIIDIICDSINPALVILIVSLVLYSFYKRRYTTGLIIFAELVLVLMLAYGIRGIDNSLHIWTSFNSDYSTHTAVCVAALFVLSHAIGRVHYWIGLFLGYAVLMVYQQYHTILDITSTTLVVAPFCQGIVYLFQRCLNIPKKLVPIR